MVRRRRPSYNRRSSFTGTPVFRGHVWILEQARRGGWKGVVTSGDRRKGVAEKYGKMSQYKLYWGWIRRLPGFNPANPPGRSTHELRSDSVAYRGPVGRPLAWWQLGLDTTDTDTLIRVLRSSGYDVRRPYPDGREAHHINFYRNPSRRIARYRRLRRKHAR